MSVRPTVAVVGALAALMACWVHLAFLRHIVDPVFHSDSPGYFLGAVQSLAHRPFTVPDARTYGYPWFLLVALRLFGTFSAVLWIQHALALATGALAGWMCRRDFRAGPFAAIGAAFCAAVTPPTVIAAHAVLTETLYGFLLMASLWAFFRAQASTGGGRSGAAAGFLAALTLLVRPVGWSLAAALALGALWRRRQAAGTASRYALAAFAIVIGTACGVSALQRGFFGLDRFAGLSLYGSAARYEDGDARFADPNWVRNDPQGPVRQMSAALPDPAALDRTLLRRALGIVIRHPWRFAADQGRMAVDVLWTRNDTPALDWDPAFDLFVYRGVLIYNAAVKDLPADHRPALAGTSMARPFLNAMDRIQRLSDAEAEQWLETLRRSDVYRIDRAFRPLRLLKPLADGLRWLPLLALAAGCFLLLTGIARWETAVLFLVVAGHLLLTNVGGDADRRHLVPIEPLGWMVGMAGASHLFRRVRRIA